MYGRTPEEWRDEAFAAFAAHTEHFLELISDLDGQRAGALVPASEWSAAQTAAHVCSLYRRLTEDRRRAPDAAGVAMQNAEDVETIGTDLDGIASEIDQRLELARAFVPSIEPNQTFPFHAGESVTIASGLGVLIGELIAHGDDIACATNARWSPLDAGLEVLWRLTMPVLQGWLTVDAAVVDRRWCFDFGWANGPVVVHVDQGTIRTELSREELDARIEHHVCVSDPVAFTLMFPYRRRPIDDPAVAELAALLQSL